MAQAAVIQDKDGYTNVRKEKSTKSEIVHKLVDNEVFFAVLDTDSNWVSVSFKNKQGKLSNGYMHRSRILPLSRMKEYKGKDFKMSIITRPFDAKAHVIHKNKEGMVDLIDGRPVWGTDGGLPNRETTKVKFSLKGRAIAIGKNKYANLFQMNDNYTVYRLGDHYFIEQTNSDGAGTYLSVWVLNEKGLQQLWVSALE